jgi:hypothetical protein
MDPLLQIQSDWNDKLNSEAYFLYIAVAKYRTLVVSKEIARRLPHIAGKNGKIGLGGIVNMPTIIGIDPNIATPQSIAACTVDFIENAELNFGSIGTKITCEEAVRQARAILQPLLIRGITFFHDNEEHVIIPLPDCHIEYPGCCGYRLTLKARLNEPYQPKCATPIAAWSGDTLSLGPVPTGGQIWLTADGTFPGPSSTGPNDTASTAIMLSDESNMTFATGTVVSFAAYAGGFAGSDVGATIAP